MIKAIDIENFANFKDFEWKKNVGNYQSDSNAVFKRNNIIYGRNYSGKTTLSRILKCLENKVITKNIENAKFSIKLASGDELTQDKLENNFKMMVYNSDFVKEKLSWFYNSESQIEPFTILGEENIEIESKIKDLNKKILEINLLEVTTKKNEAETSYKNIEKQIENALIREARGIKEKGLDVTYNKTKLLNDINSKEIEIFKKLTLDEVCKKQTILKDEEIEKIREIDFSKIKFFEDLVEINKLLEKKIEINEPIKKLLEDNILQNWVRSGMELSKNKYKDTCIFCGGNLNEKFWGNLENHFNKESDELLSKLKEYISIVGSVKKEITKRRESLLRLEGFSLSYIEKINKLRLNLDESYEKFLNFLIIVEKELEKKCDYLITTLECIELNIDSKDHENLENELNSLIKENNDYIDNLENVKSKIRTELRLNEVKNIVERINYKNLISEKENGLKKCEDAKKIFDTQNRECSSMKKEIEYLESQKKNEEKAAQRINEYLRKYFGKVELKLVSNEEGHRFDIVRGEHGAKYLSEGECSIISFCYFLAKISDDIAKVTTEKELIIYIDDPISSLDSNHIFNIFSLISKLIIEKDNYLQLFISTHNLDFLKYLKRLKISQDETKHFLIERKMKSTESASFISCMPEYLKKFTTEFHYLFNEIYEFSQSSKGDKSKKVEYTYNQFYNMPNNMRKFLEYYLFFKYPNNENPLSNLDKLFDGNIPIKINRIINEYSHLTFIDRGWQPMDVPEVEECAKEIIRIIKEKDTDQYNALLESIQ
ncbi:MAG: AAA family ATPase [Bacilli bacterium]